MKYKKFVFDPGKKKTPLENAYAKYLSMTGQEDTSESLYEFDEMVEDMIDSGLIEVSEGQMSSSIPSFY